MPIDIEKERLLTLTEATKVLPRMNGKRASICTLWRWCRKGLRGVSLDYVRVGRRIATSRESLNRFFNALAAADAPLVTAPPVPRPWPRVTSKSRQRAIEEAERRCIEMGV